VPAHPKRRIAADAASPRASSASASSVAIGTEKGRQISISRPARTARWRSHSARPRARRNQLRTVEGGRASSRAILRWPWPATALNRASPRVSTASLRRGRDHKGNSTWVASHRVQMARLGRSATWEPSRWRMSRDRA
jgi:hypothetical protein